MTPTDAQCNAARATKSLIHRARRRYWHWPATARPNLSDPASYLVLFTLDELTELAWAGRWPLSANALARIAESPAERRRRRRAFQLRVEAVLARILTTKAPAVRSLLFARRNGAANGKA